MYKGVTVSKQSSGRTLVVRIPSVQVGVTWSCSVTKSETSSICSAGTRTGFRLNFKLRRYPTITTQLAITRATHLYTNNCASDELSVMYPSVVSPFPGPQQSRSGKQKIPKTLSGVSWLVDFWCFVRHTEKVNVFTTHLPKYS